MPPSAIVICQGRIFSPMPAFVSTRSQGRVLISARIAALPVAECVYKSARLSKKQQLTGLFCEQDARNGCGASCYGRAETALEGGSRDEAGAGK